MLDRIGAKRPVVLGCAVAAVGFALWAAKATDLNLSSQIWFIVLAGAGLGLMQGQANTDANNRASSLSYGAATGITQARPPLFGAVVVASALPCHYHRARCTTSSNGRRSGFFIGVNGRSAG